jgi:hypothetical protein
MEGDHMTTNNYILARWRDAITDPPEHGGLYRITLPSGRSDAHARFAKMHGWLTIDTCEFLRVVQWLDITAIPGVARTQVQAAVDGIESRRCAIPGQSYDPHRQGVESGLAQGLRELRNHTGVTPKEVTNG